MVRYSHWQIARLLIGLGMGTVGFAYITQLTAIGQIFMLGLATFTLYLLFFIDGLRKKTGDLMLSFSFLYLAVFFLSIVFFIPQQPDVFAFSILLVVLLAQITYGLTRTRYEIVQRPVRFIVVIGLCIVSLLFAFPIIPAFVTDVMTGTITSQILWVTFFIFIAVFLGGVCIFLDLVHKAWQAHKREELEMFNRWAYITIGLFTVVLTGSFSFYRHADNKAIAFAEIVAALAAVFLVVQAAQSIFEKRKKH